MAIYSCIDIWFLFLFLYLILTNVKCEVDLNSKLDDSLKATQKIIDEIFSRWQIDKFPKFLQSAAMTKTSWDVLKLKFEHKILKVFTNKLDSENIVISFMGSSVTAGHDSPFIKSFPVLTGNKMAPAFKPLNINLITRNAAMGNNPCMPYDICVKTFAGQDADIVHWEQSYNCMSGKPYIFEQFIRQSIQMPSRPVVVFSDSATPNWKEEDCNNKPSSHDLKEEEKSMLQSYQGGHYEDIVCNLNKDQVGRWDELHKGKDLLSNYKTAGIQLFQHSSHEGYKCMGPYVKEWQCCSASWHPSLLGSHFFISSYFTFYL